MNCPTCGSPNPAMHPSTQAEGEVTHICTDEFHRPLPPVRDENDRKGHGTVRGRQDF